MFYTTISIIVINLFLLSLHVPVAKKDKFTKYIVFKEALYRGLFNHTTGVADIGGADIPFLIEPLNAAEALSLPTTEGDRVHEGCYMESELPSYIDILCAQFG